MSDIVFDVAVRHSIHGDVATLRTGRLQSANRMGVPYISYRNHDYITRKYGDSDVHDKTFKMEAHGYDISHYHRNTGNSDNI